MNEQRIREIAEQSSTHAEETVDYYMGQSDGLTWEAKILKARDLKFALLLVERFDRILVNEYLDCVGENDKKSQLRIDRLRNRVKEYFGVEQ